jgi:hypothetical protein
MSIAYYKKILVNTIINYDFEEFVRVFYILKNDYGLDFNEERFGLYFLLDFAIMESRYQFIEWLIENGVTRHIVTNLNGITMSVIENALRNRRKRLALINKRRLNRDMFNEIMKYEYS